MPTATQLTVNVNDARCLALFASGLQPSDAPTAETVGWPARRLRDVGQARTRFARRLIITIGAGAT